MRFKKVKVFFLSFIFVYASLCAFMYVKQRSLLFFPVSEVSADTTVQFFQVNNQRIKVWVLQPEKNEAIIYFGGNAENVAHNIDAYTRLFPEHTVYFVNYRGYAGSSGSPSEAALFEDAVAVFDGVKTKHSNISVIGRSLGSGVAVHLAAVRSVSKMVLVTAYDSIASVAQRKYIWLPVSLLIKDRFDSVLKLPKLSVPILVLSAEHDRVIPFQHTERLINAIDKRFVQAKKILGTSHNNIEQGQEYYPLLKAFINTPF